ncbi:DnaJ-like protein subfamily C member 28 [Frankliniella fusca]|uniref:DnaJ-like protein subfamily C member 28 n=1 Tax=Frankliniella fusca TaxID=407009 RepID=A0AAE1HYJ5_9NEOP|nr:DnaJ-like protein subfamily C member 28 [Frankliniella fusca]
MLTSVGDVTIRWKGLMHFPSPTLNLLRALSTSPPTGSSKKEILRCYRVLKVPDDCNIDDIRSAFISLAKKYHPDSGSPDADAKKFQEVESAYRTLHAKFANDEKTKISEEENGNANADVKEYDIQHTAPQHRQYLSYDGFGAGTPAQRQKQYQKKRAMEAVDNVMAHRLRNFNLNCSHNREEALVAKDKVESKKIKTRYGMDRLVEDLIQESMAKGDFDNLSGKGKPLKQGVANPYVDFTTHKLNEVLIDNGFTPEWILLQKEIREERDFIRESLTSKRKGLGPLPLSYNEELAWKQVIESCQTLVQQLNKKINKYNLVVPILQKQMLQFQLDKEANKILMEVPGTKLNSNRALKQTYQKESGASFSDFLSIIFGK